MAAADLRLASLDLATTGRIDDPDERTRVTAFLNGGSIVMLSLTESDDELDGRRTGVVPRGFVTDGTWIWPAALGYYTGAHGVAPEPEFYEHILSCGYTAAEPDDEAVLDRAAALLNAVDSEAPGTGRPGR